MGTLIGDRIRDLRKKMGMTQEEFAEIADMHRSAIAKYEGGTLMPKAASLEKLATALGVSMSYLMTGEQDPPLPSNAYPLDDQAVIPILGEIRSGPGGTAEQTVEGYGLADVANPTEHFLLRVVGDSMEPDITPGMLALIHRQEDVENGEIAAVGIDGEEGTLKMVRKQDGAVILQAFNPHYAPRVFAGRDLSRLTIFGKLVETRRRW